MIPALLTVLLCLFGLLYGKYRAGPDPKEFYESNFSDDGISAKQTLLSELQASLSRIRERLDEEIQSSKSVDLHNWKTAGTATTPNRNQKEFHSSHP